MARNPYVTGGDFPVPRPLDYNNPQIQKLATAYSKQSLANVSQEIGQRGLGDTSFYPAALQRGFQTGFRQAVGDYQQQQALYSQYSQNLMQLQAGQGPEQQDPSFLQNFLGGATTGATIGGSAAGGPGALWGGLIGGGLAGLGGLFG